MLLLSEVAEVADVVDMVELVCLPSSIRFFIDRVPQMTDLVDSDSLELAFDCSKSQLLVKGVQIQRVRSLSSFNVVYGHLF